MCACTYKEGVLLNNDLPVRHVLGACWVFVYLCLHDKLGHKAIGVWCGAEQRHEDDGGYLFPRTPPMKDTFKKKNVPNHSLRI